MSLSGPSVPVVTVITPCLNGIRFLPDMVASLKRQSLAEWELIYVDDGSTDGSLKYMETVAADDPRVRIFRTSGRQGASTARNLGISEARARFVAFLDSDDWWLPEKLELQVEQMVRERAAFSCTGYWVCHEDGSIIRAQKVFGPVTSRRHLRKQAVIGCLTVMYESAALRSKRFRTHLAGAEDYVLWYEMLDEVERRGLTTTFLPQPLACYRVHDAGKSRNKLHARSHWTVYRKALGLSRLKAASCFASYVVNALYDRRPSWLRRSQ
jgi:teichuronic acid biosynthesis glycosyltransferase TuaG